MTAATARVLARALAASSRTARARVTPPAPDGVRRIVVLQMSGVGDLLLITPALRALHRRYPGARIDLVTYRLANAPFVFRLPYAGRGCEFPLFDLRLRDVWRASFRRALRGPVAFARAEPTDLWVSFHHPWLPQWVLLELWLAARSGARFRVGVTPDWLPGPGVFDRALPESRLGDRHYRPFFLDVVGLLGAPGDQACGEPPKDVAAEFPLEAHETAAARARVAGALPGRRPVVCLHPGASHVAQRWPADRFRDLALRLVADGCGIVLIGTDAERRVLTPLLAALPPGTWLDGVGGTSLIDAAALVDASDLFIGNDSGPLHIAVARGRPAIGLVGRGQPRYYGYEPGEAVILINPGDPGPDRGKDHAIDWRLGVDEVHAAARRLLR